MTAYDQPPVRIDKISFTLDGPDTINTDDTCQRLVELFETGKLPGSRWKPGRRYKVQMVIPIYGDDLHETGTMSFETGPRFTGIPPSRTEFNPAKIGPEGVSSVMSIIHSIFGEDPYPSLPQLMVTRLDLALDLPGLCNDQVIVRNKGQRKHGVYSDQKGRPETQYLGGSRSNQTAAYTKRQKGTADCSLRIERRMKPRCHGFQLIDLPDPFRTVQLVHTRSLLPHLNGLNPEHFFDSIRLRGFTHVLAKLPPTQRKAIKSVLNDAGQSLLPSTDEIWLSWPEVLKDSGLGFLIADIAGHVPLAADHTNAFDKSNA